MKPNGAVPRRRSSIKLSRFGFRAPQAATVGGLKVAGILPSIDLDAAPELIILGTDEFDNLVVRRDLFTRTVNGLVRLGSSRGIDFRAYSRRRCAGSAVSGGGCRARRASRRLACLGPLRLSFHNRVCPPTCGQWQMPRRLGAAREAASTVDVDVARNWPRTDTSWSSDDLGGCRRETASPIGRQLASGLSFMSVAIALQFGGPRSQRWPPGMFALISQNTGIGGDFGSRGGAGT